MLSAYRFITYNLSVAYEFDSTQDWLEGTKLRMSVINLTDKEPPLASANFGYDPSVSQSLLSGRSWNLEVSRRF